MTRPDGSAGRWTPRTGLSSGERRLVVLAPMLAAMAAAYDKYGQAGCRLAALDEIPSEVDERGREGLARYIAELDLDLVCTSYLWDGAPGAWDGVDAHDLEAAPEGTVVASGTPSEREVSAIARLAEADWHTRVRADFDVAGLVHAATLLSGIPGATPWRMGVTDYETSLPQTQRVSLDPARVPETPWEPALAATIRSVGSAAFEEALMPQLLGDLRAAASRKPRWPRRTRSL